MEIEGNKITINGKLVKILQFREEWDIDVTDPEQTINDIKRTGIKADIFSFIQRLPDSRPKFDYYMEWESTAALPIKTYEYWLKKQISQNSRKKIGLAKRKGVELRICDFNDDFVREQLTIYNETPIRQMKPDKAYGMTFERAKKANSTFLDRAVFLGAYYKKELIISTHRREERVHNKGVFACRSQTGARMYRARSGGACCRPGTGGAERKSRCRLCGRERQHIQKRRGCWHSGYGRPSRK